MSKLAENLVSPEHDALIIVDMQNDFVLPTGALSVPGSLEVIPVINAIARSGRFRAVVATKDWHPPNHSSFVAFGGCWPVHCVQGTPGAELHTELDVRALTHIVHKGVDVDAESYSAFADEKEKTSGLAAMLNAVGVRRVFVCGVAYDYCVYSTAISALKGGFSVVVLEDAVRAVCSDSGLEEKKNELMQKGAVLAKGIDLLFPNES